MTGYKTYTIPKGKNRSGTYFRPHIFKCKIEAKVKFDKSGVYLFHDEDQYDINKLFGLSYGRHHSNSVRFGWRSYGPYNKQIELLAYCYVDGYRLMEGAKNRIKVSDIELNKEYILSISTSDKSHVFTVKDGFNILGTQEIPHKGVPCWGYHLYPYFGGNKPAPHDVTIDMDFNTGE